MPISEQWEGVFNVDFFHGHSRKSGITTKADLAEV